MVKTRFCPSPTGYLHIGNVRTALFNVLFAIANQGQCLLRIEDTDEERSKPEFTSMIYRDLQWLALTWQEGPEVGGNHAPYYQSQRQEIYGRYYQQLIKQNDAYFCFCSEEQLALTRKLQRVAGKPPRYPGTCRHLTPTQVAERQAAGEKATLRFKVPIGKVIAFEDLVRGQQRFLSDDLSDFIIRRTDGTSPFMFCNAIDDALMEVTHALRGEDHLTNTPRQVLILKTLNLPQPQYGHISLILGDDGTPLSKRNGSRSINELRQAGYLPLAIINYLARLGHYYANDAFMSLTQLASEFKSHHLNRSPARYDGEQLKRWQKLALAHCEASNLWDWLPPEAKALVPEVKKALFLSTIQHNVLLPDDGLEWARIIFMPLIYSQAVKTELLSAGASFYEQVLKTIKQTGLNYPSLTKSLKDNLDVNGKALFMPLRLTLTGVQHGPELASLLDLIGEDEVVKRFTHVLAWFN